MAKGFILDPERSWPAPKGFDIQANLTVNIVHGLTASDDIENQGIKAIPDGKFAIISLDSQYVFMGFTVEDIEPQGCSDTGLNLFAEVDEKEILEFSKDEGAYSLILFLSEGAHVIKFQIGNCDANPVEHLIVSPIEIRAVSE